MPWRRLEHKNPTDLAGQCQNRVRQTLERHFGVQLGQVVLVVLVGATASSWDRRRHPFCARGGERRQVLVRQVSRSFVFLPRCVI